MSTDRIQVTPASGTVLQGEPHVMAVQFVETVLHPLLMALAEREGAHTVVGFYSGLVACLALDAQSTLGTHHAEHIFACALKAMRSKPKVAEFYSQRPRVVAS
jgi:hypothetical protein